MKKLFVSALTILNILFASAQEEKMDISFTPVDNNTETSTKAESEPVESQVVAPEEPKSYESKPATQPAIQQASAKPAVQQTQAQSVKPSTESKSDDYDSDFFASNNEAASSDGEIKNVLGLRFGACTSKATSGLERKQCFLKLDCFAMKKVID